MSNRFSPELFKPPGKAELPECDEMGKPIQKMPNCPDCGKDQLSMLAPKMAYCFACTHWFVGEKKA